MISVKKENQLLYSMSIRDYFGKYDKEDFKTLFPELAAETIPVRMRLKYEKTDKPSEILPGELDPEKTHFETMFLNLGQMYYSGNGRNINIKKAIFYFHVATEWGENQLAIYYLSEIYANGHTNVIPMNKGRSTYLLAGIIGLRKEKNAFENELESKAAILIAKNLLSPKSLVKTTEDKEYIKRYVIAADIFEYFEDYTEYSQKERNEAAIKLLKMAAKSKNPEALFMLAELHEAGQSVERDTLSATRYYYKAHEAGHSKGRVNFDRLLKQRKEEITEEKPQPKTNNALPLANNSKKHASSNAEHTEPGPKKIKLAPVIQASSTVETVKTTLQDFHPHIQPSSLNYEDIKFSERKTQSVSPNKKYEPEITAAASSSQLELKNTALTENAKKEIGRWGEEYIYLALFQHYKEKMERKYGSCQVKETEKGFELSSGKNSIKIIWHNKGMDVKKDSGEDNDIMITKNENSISKKKYIEVKATTSGSDNIADFSKNEVLKMLACHQSATKYRILRVYNAGKEDVKITKIKDPFQLISQSMLEVSSMSLKI
ncbi:MAG: DUF3883 domain-containing protein [Legionellales bacterium]|jgi:TPR repeat protein